MKKNIKINQVFNNSPIKVKIENYNLIRETNESFFTFQIDIDNQKFIYNFQYSGNPILDCLILNFNEKNINFILEQFNDILSNNEYFYSNDKSYVKNPQNYKFSLLKEWFLLIKEYSLSINKIVTSNTSNSLISKNIINNESIKNNLV